jgi:hypothetical protein
MASDETVPKPPRRLTPILVGGLAIALAENLPGLSLLDWVCCGTIWSGAVLAVYLRWRQNPQPGVAFGEAVSIGVKAALVGAILNLTIDLAFKKSLLDSLRFFGEDTGKTAETLRELLPEAISKRMPMLLPTGFIAISVVVHLIVGAIGGMLGATIFSPRKEDRVRGSE